MEAIDSVGPVHTDQLRRLNTDESINPIQLTESDLMFASLGLIIASKVDRFIYWDHCLLLIDRCQKPFRDGGKNL